MHTYSNSMNVLIFYIYLLKVEENKINFLIYRLWYFLIGIIRIYTFFFIMLIVLLLVNFIIYYVNNKILKRIVYKISRDSSFVILIL